MAAPPPVQGLGLHPQFFARQPESLILKEKVLSLSGDSFSIKNAQGQPLFQVKGDAFSLSGRKHFAAMDGTPLFDIRKEHFTIHTTFYCENPQGEKIFHVKSKFSIGSSKAIGSFTGPQGQVHELLMKGDFFDTKANITDSVTGQVVATIDRKFFNASELLGGQQTYAVTIQPGIDMALICAMCICLDEKRNEK